MLDKAKGVMEKAKAWAYEIPTYNSKNWEKVDQIVDSTLEKAFANQYVQKMAEIPSEFKKSNLIKVAGKKIEKFIDGFYKVTAN